MPLFNIHRPKASDQRVRTKALYLAILVGIREIWESGLVSCLLSGVRATHKARASMIAV